MLPFLIKYSLRFGTRSCRHLKTKIHLFLPRTDHPKIFIASFELFRLVMTRPARFCIVVKCHYVPITSGNPGECKIHMEQSLTFSRDPGKGGTLNSPGFWGMPLRACSQASQSTTFYGLYLAYFVRGHVYTHVRLIKISIVKLRLSC